MRHGRSRIPSSVMEMVDPSTVWVVGSRRVAWSTTRPASITEGETRPSAASGSGLGTKASTTKAPPGASQRATLAKQRHWALAVVRLNKVL